MNERFWSYVNKTDTCWFWTGAKTGGRNGGYGKVWWEGKVRNAHKLSYEWSLGPVPAGLQIDHLCRVRSCVNPEHMELVTSAENTRRGVPFRKRVRRTHCKRGHEMTDANTLIEGGWCKCKECRNAGQRRRRKGK